MEQYELPDVPSNWAKVPLSELVASTGIFSDGDWVESKDQDPNGEVRLVQLADVGELAFTDRSDRWLTKIKADNLRCLYLEKGDILISRLGDPLGKSCIYPGSDRAAVTVVDVCVLRIGHDFVDSRLLAYFINSPYMRAQIETHAGGTTRKRITGRKLKKTKILLPPLAEQKRIVDKIERLFSYLDEGERLLEQVQMQITTYRQAVLKAAITGELTKEWRAANHDKVESGEELLKRILEERKKSWQDRGKYQEPITPNIGGLSKLPENWTWAALGQLFQVFIGSTPSRREQEYWNGDIPWVSSGEVAFCRINKTRERISKAGYQNSSVKLHPPGTILLAMIGEGKTRGQAAILDVEACHNQNSAAIRVSETPIPPDYVFYMLLHNYENTRLCGQGGSQPALNGQKVKELQIALPPLEEISQILTKVDVAMEAANRLEFVIANEMSRIASTKQSILKTAFLGELVDQDPDDEPACELLARIQEEQKQVKASTPRSGRTSKRSASV